jgi:hypothetical protein
MMPRLKCWKKITSFAWADSSKSGVTIGRDWFGKYGKKEKYFVERWTPSIRKIIEKNIDDRTQADSIVQEYMKDHDSC